MTRRPPRLLTVGLCVNLVLGAAACTSNQPSVTSLRVLASPELADMQPVLDDLRRDTGIELVLDYQGIVDASNSLTRGDDHHDLAWLSSDRYFQLKLAASSSAALPPLSTNIMSSPVVIGVKPKTAEILRARTQNPQLSWADFAEGAAAGLVHFGLADPRHENSGLSALVGVATAAAGTGGALRPQDVSCDRLRGFLTGQTLTANTSQQLIDEFVTHQGDTDAVISYESTLLSLNASGRLAEPLEIIYPRDGIVLSQYPLLLLNPTKRAAYNTVIDWLSRESTQQKIMDRTLRRPLDPNVPRDPRLRTEIGNALYYPDRLEVINTLLADYDPNARAPGDVIFLLDFSGSMKGDRIAALRSTFDGLSGTDTSSIGKFVRFYQGEKFTLVRFGGQVLAEQDFTIGGTQDIDAMRAFLAVDQFDGHTAIWSALDHAYQRAGELVRANPRQPISIVLMTDGRNNAGLTLDDFLNHYQALPAAVRAVHTYTIRLGEADPAELDRVARATGGHLVDATATSLQDAFKETRGCR